MDGTSCKCTYHEMFVSNDVLFSRLDRKETIGMGNWAVSLVQESLLFLLLNTFYP
jgi:hypothetical protein